jgi:Mce-associated membrane protein
MNTGGKLTQLTQRIKRAIRRIRRAEGAHGGPVRAGRRTVLTAGLVAATVLATALSAWLGVLLSGQRTAEQRRQDVLAAARQSALNFTSLDYRHYGRDSANVLKGATGDFKKEFAAQTEELTKLVTRNKSVSEGQVLDAGIVRSDEHSARVLVVADSKVTNTAAPEGQARTYRLQLDLVHQDGRWLTSDVAFVG